MPYTELIGKLLNQFQESQFKIIHYIHTYKHTYVRVSLAVKLDMTWRILNTSYSVKICVLSVPLAYIHNYIIGSSQDVERLPSYYIVTMLLFHG